ncbi:MAG: hypothetical protein QG568_670 [Patescibacteria group bacterium]|nr:hypothetical protein [Patescibacteria group bacterium]
MWYYLNMKALVIALVVLAMLWLLAQSLQVMFVERPIESIMLNQKEAQILLNSAAVKTGNLEK